MIARIRPDGSNWRASYLLTGHSAMHLGAAPRWDVASRSGGGEAPYKLFSPRPTAVLTRKSSLRGIFIRSYKRSLLPPIR